MVIHMGPKEHHWYQKIICSLDWTIKKLQDVLMNRKLRLRLEPLVIEGTPAYIMTKILKSDCSSGGLKYLID